MSFVSRRAIAFVVPALIALLSTTCAEAPTGDRRLTSRHANLALATTFTPAAKAAAALIHAAGLDVDRVQVIIGRSSTETLRDTSIAFGTGQDQTLTLDVPVDPGTVLTATVNYFAGTVLLYSGTTTVTAYAPDTPADQIPTSTITVVAVAPGVSATRVTVVGPGPSPTTAPVTLTAHAFLASGAEIPGAIFGWSVDDATIATISAAGVLQPTAKSGTIQVTAITLSGASATTAVTFYGPAARIVAVSGDAQTAEVGTALAQPFVIQVQSATGGPVPNQTVTFGAANGASVAPTTATTDANGRAQTIPTLGTTPGTYGFTATTGAFSTPISATATTAPPATLSVVSGDAQADTIQKTLKNPLVVKVVDRFGNPNVGVQVGWARTAGVGTLSAATTTTDANGQTSITYTLGVAAGSEAIAASVTGVTAVATFSATALPKPASIAVLAGDNQSGVAGKALTTQIAFKVLDTQGNPSPNVTVTFQTANGGSFVPTSLATDASGVVKTTWTLGAAVGPQTMTASATGLTGSPVIVSATATAPPAVALQFVQPPSAVAAGAVMASVTVRAIDASGNAVPSFSGTVTIAIGTNPNQGTLGGILTRTAVSGMATFNDLTVSAVGVGYTLAVSSPGLTGIVSAPISVTTPPNARIEWTNAQGGNWSVESNWSLNRLPASNDSVVIALAGTYTVNMDVPTAFIGSVVVVGGTGTGQQTLLLSQSHTIIANTALAVKPSGVLRLSNSGVGGAGSLNNEGTILIPNVGSIAMPLVMSHGSTLRVASDGSVGSAGVSIAAGFTNNGTIDLSSTIGAYDALMTVSGTLLNAADGVITASTGTLGRRFIDAQLDNRGRIDVLAELQLSNAIATTTTTHTNIGTINVQGADFKVVHTGVGASFTNNGTVTVGQSRTWSVTGGLLTQTAASTLNGGGAISLSGTTAAFNAPVALGAISLTNVATAVFQTALSTASTVITLDGGSSLNGPATVTNVSGATLTTRNSTINAPLDNRGTLIANDNNTINGTLTTAQGSIIRVQADGQVGLAELIVNSSFTNNGSVELTSTVGAYDARLNLSGNTLTNAPTGAINALAGAGGNRALRAQLANQGVVNVSEPLTIDGGAAHTNSGSINVALSDVTVNQATSFTNTGTIAVNAGRTVTVNAGAFNVQTSSTLAGEGTLVLDNATGNFGAAYVLGGLTVRNNAVVNLQTDLSTATTNVSLQFATINGPGHLVNASNKTLTMKGSVIGATSALDNSGTLVATADNTINGPLTASNGSITIQSDGSVGEAHFNVASGFTNNGTINLSSTVGAYTASINIPNGTLTNGFNGIINAATGAGGPRTINATLTNQGSVVIDAPLTLGQPGAAHANVGSISLASGDFAINYGSGTGGFTNAGGISIGAGRTMTVTGGTFAQNSSLTGTGTLTLSNVTTTFSNANLPSSLNVSGGALTANTSLSTATTAMSFVNTTINSNGLVNAAGKTLTMRDVSYNSTGSFNNQGAIDFIGNNSIDAAVIAGTTSQMKIYSDGTGAGGGSATLTVANGFDNHGTMDLTSVTGAYPSAIAVTSGVLANVSPGTLTTSVGAGGERFIYGHFVNFSTMTLNAPLTLDKPTESQQNSGTITLGQGNLTVKLGAGMTFTNTQVITIPTGRTMAVTGGFYSQTSSANVSGAGVIQMSGVQMDVVGTFTPGSLSLLAGTVANINVPLTTANGLVLTVDNSTLGGSASLNNVNGHVVTLRNAIVSMPIMNGGQLNSIGHTTISASAGLSTSSTSQINIYTEGTASGDAQLMVPAFTNNGTVQLTSVTGNYPSTLALSNGTLINNGTISSLAGSGGTRSIVGSVSNNGTINVARNDASVLSVSQSYTSSSSAVINLELGGTAPGGSSVFATNTAAGTSTSLFVGAVSVAYANGFTAAPNDQFTILQYRAGSTVEAAFSLPGGASGWGQVNAAAGVTITKQ